MKKLISLIMLAAFFMFAGNIQAQFQAAVRSGGSSGGGGSKKDCEAIKSMANTICISAAIAARVGGPTPATLGAGACIGAQIRASKSEACKQERAETTARLENARKQTGLYGQTCSMPTISRDRALEKSIEAKSITKDCSTKDKCLESGSRSGGKSSGGGSGGGGKSGGGSSGGSGGSSRGKL